MIPPPFEQKSKLSDRERILGDRYHKNGVNIGDKIRLAGAGLSAVSGLHGSYRGAIGLKGTQEDYDAAGHPKVKPLADHYINSDFASDLGRAAASSYILGSTIRNRMRIQDREFKEGLSSKDGDRLRAIEKENFARNSVKAIMLGASANLGLHLSNQIAKNNYKKAVLSGEGASSANRKQGLSNAAALLLGLGGGLAAGAGAIYAYDRHNKLKDERYLREALSREKSMGRRDSGRKSL